MTSSSTTAFDLPDRLAAKADPALVGPDEQHFAAIAQCLDQTIADLEDRLAGERKQAGRYGQHALERDLEIHRITSRLHGLRRFGLDLCLGRMVPDIESPEPVYVGRFGLTDSTGRQLLVDWRSDAAEPFFGASHGDPMGLVSRRRYRWTRGRVTDYWDEVFTLDGLEDNAALDDQSAFIASLGERRSGRMRDVLATIQADQDAVVRAGSQGTLVVDGGPGTGKTVVALHRSAYLLYSDPRLAHRRGGVLFVGPHRPYLAYVADVLPSLGEDGVQTCMLRDLVAEGADAPQERDPEVARLKSSAQLVKAIEPAVRLYEETPTQRLLVETPWADVWVTPGDWAEAFGSPDPDTPHNDARDQIWEALVTILLDRLADAVADGGDWDSEPVPYSDSDGHDGGGGTAVPPDQLRRSLRQNDALTTVFNRAWPLLEATDIVGDLFTVPAYLRMCAPHLDIDEVRRLQREDAQAWTLSDLPLIDAARHRLGDPEESGRKLERAAAQAAQREEMDRVVDHLIATDDSEMHLMSMLRGSDLESALVDQDVVRAADPDLLAGPFAHVVVDEAQELTDAQWQMLLLRCPTRSFTVVGDRAQARRGFAESWQERLDRVGLDRITQATLRINYRTPTEVMAEAEPVIRAVLPDANVPTSIRSTGRPVVHGSVADLVQIVDEWMAGSSDGVACVIGEPTYPATPRVQSLTPELAKGLEFDLVVLVDRHPVGNGTASDGSIEASVDRYVAMTRATQQLVILTSG